MLSKLALEHIQKLLEVEGLVVDLREEWASIHPDHRQKLRLELVRQVKSTSWGQQIESLDPGDLGGKLRGLFSVSHSPVAAGFAYFTEQKGLLVGLDLEQSSRVKTATVRRISSEAELGLSPDSAALWVAKEAFYKALPPPQQPSTIGDIEISNWSTADNNFYTFEGCVKGLLQFHNGSGLIHTIGSLIMGLYILYPQHSLTHADNF